MDRRDFIDYLAALEPDEFDAIIEEARGTGSQKAARMQAGRDMFNNRRGGTK
ncbi:hypothetical protein [Rhodococcus sp. USK13]|uniref:hypothetical protein n=1 Tax=Rhodococcus sp. USK13 TaxID=2806442 RepID=UPI001BD01222|nr:hypothetical protein [Rhodococcus sp. USK13]